MPTRATNWVEFLDIHYTTLWVLAALIVIIIALAFGPNGGNHQ